MSVLEAQTLSVARESVVESGGRGKALALLVRLLLRAKFRRSLRGATTGRGVVFLILGLIVLVIWLAPTILSAHVVQRPDPLRTQAVFPILLLGMCLSNLVTSAGERAVAFSPAEADLLFAAPFTRRQLLGYKIALGAVGAFTASLLFSVIFLRYTTFWLAGLVSIFLSFMLLQLLSMTVVMIGQTIGEHAYARSRKVGGLIVLGLLALAAVPVVRSNPGSFFGITQQFRQTSAAKVLLAPFDVFGRIITAPAIFPDMLMWSGIAVGLLGGLVLIVMWLDAHYLEVSAAAGQRVYARIQRVRRAGGMSLRTTGSARLRLPMPPRFAGAGPIAWRQLTSALRQSRSLLVLLLLICLGGGPAMYAAGVDPGSGTAIIGISFWLTMMLANTLRFDFRGDVDQIDLLKALPLRPLAVAAAQLVAPTVVMTVMQLALLAGLTIIFEVPGRDLLLIVALILPFNIILFSIENIIFLLFPARYASGPGDLQGFGRQMIVFMMKLIGLTIPVGLAAAIGAIAYAATQSPMTGFVVGGIVLWLESIAILPAVVGAYLRFDPSTDTPA